MNRQSTPKKIEAAIKNLQKANEKNKSKVFDVWVCKHCGVEKKGTVHQKRKKYCSNKCVSEVYKEELKGNKNPNYRDEGIKTCFICKIQYKNYNKTTKFCSMKCRDIHGLSPVMRNNARKDENHNMIVELLEKGGAIVKDMSKAMYGFPDLLVWHFEKWHLVEIKNPKTYYGKQGLNKLQKKWAEEWRGGPVFIMRTEEDVDKFIIGEFEEIDQVKNKPQETNQIC
jgi:protein-arginine kinase activator protein McsA